MFPEPGGTYHDTEQTEEDIRTRLKASRGDLNAMRLQLQRGTNIHAWSDANKGHLPGFMYNTSLSSPSSPLGGVTKAQVYLHLQYMNFDVEGGRTVYPYNSSSGQFRSGLIEFSKKVTASPPVSMNPLKRTAIPNLFKDAKGCEWRIDLENLRGENLKN